MTNNGNAEDAVKSLLEVPIEKPVFLSDAALTNLYNISHNVQESYRKVPVSKIILFFLF